MNLVASEGVLRYGSDDRLVVEVDPGLAKFYRSLVPPEIKFQKPRYAPHITVVRQGMEQIPQREHWGKYEGQGVRFKYDPFIYQDEMYLWLNVWCGRLKEIRQELGLPALNVWCLPPGGRSQCFHTTLGNMKFNGL